MQIIIKLDFSLLVHSSETDSPEATLTPTAPARVNLGRFTPNTPGGRLKHDLSSGDILIIDDKTFFIPNFHYDGTAPTAYFFVGKGMPIGDKKGLKVPDENGS
jgi:hypothetical protein